MKYSPIADMNPKAKILLQLLSMQLLFNINLNMT